MTNADNKPDSATQCASRATVRGTVSLPKFVQAAVTGAGALAASGRIGWAQASDTIEIGFITPRPGAAGALAETDGFVLDTARKLLADGISAGGKTYKIEILDRDTQSDPTRAGQLAKSLINSDGVDFMLTSATPETVNPVSDACEAAGVPCLSTGMPWEPGSLQGLHLAMERPGEDQQQGRV